MAQPIIRGIQAVGSVSVTYQYNGNGGVLQLPSGLMKLNDQEASIHTKGGVEVSGFRLDSQFLRANPQIASSFQIPLLGGGAIALTNNNRSGTLNIACTRVSTPVPAKIPTSAGNTSTSTPITIKNSNNVGAMAQFNDFGMGPFDADNVYDLVFLAQAQQAQPGGDSLGATLVISFTFCGLATTLEFQGCTIASVDPVGLAGNDAVDYNVAINYLNWTMNASSGNPVAVTESSALQPKD